MHSCTHHVRLANYNMLWLQCICAKNYENWLAVDKVIAKIGMLTFLAHPVYALKLLAAETRNTFV